MATFTWLSAKSVNDEKWQWAKICVNCYWGVEIAIGICKFQTLNLYYLCQVSLEWEIVDGFKIFYLYNIFHHNQEPQQFIVGHKPLSRKEALVCFNVSFLFAAMFSCFLPFNTREMNRGDDTPYSIICHMTHKKTLAF